MSSMEGVEVKVGKRTFTVPPLTVWLSERLAKPESYATPRDMAELVRDVLAENYPDLSIDDVMKALPATPKRLTETLKAVIAAAMMESETATGEAGGP